MIENSCLTKERILYLIKKNQFNLIKKHRLISLLKFNIDLDHDELNNFITDKLNKRLKNEKWIKRKGLQFHWHNKDYNSLPVTF
jgi:predicted N-acyltransferase